MSDKNCLMKTAKDAITGKASVVQNQYKVECTSLPISKGKRQVPILNKVYYSRMRVIRHLFLSYDKACKSLGILNTQILVLGAGYDSSLTEHGHSVFYVDYPAVLSDRYNQGIDINSPHVKLVPGDLNHPETVMDSLISSGFNPSLPTFMLLESVLAYLSPARASGLIQFLSVRVSVLFGALYDPLAPPPSAPEHRCGEALQRTFRSRQVPLLSALPSVEELCVFLRRCGMRHVQTMSMLDAVQLVSDRGEEEERGGGGGESCLSGNEDHFDEFAALATLHRLYAISYFSNSCSSLFTEVTRVVFSGGSARGAEGMRLRALERRLLSFETANNIHLERPGHGNCTLRPATCVDERDILTIFNEGHSSFRELYPPVQSHMKQAGKTIKSALAALQRKGPESSESVPLFWVAEDIKDGDGETAASKSSGRGTSSKRRKVVGCASLRVTSSANDSLSGRRGSAGGSRVVGILSHLSVREQCRGRGIGRSLVRRVIESARDRGCVAVDLTTLADMTAARSLYRSMGFDELEVTDIGNGCQLVHMVLPLLSHC